MGAIAEAAASGHAAAAAQQLLSYQRRLPVVMSMLRVVAVFCSARLAATTHGMHLRFLERFLKLPR